MFTLAKATRLFTQLKTRENTLPRWGNVIK